MLNPLKHTDKFDLHLLQIFDSGIYETENVSREKVGSHGCSYTILNARITNNLLILYNQDD